MRSVPPRVHSMLAHLSGLLGLLMAAACGEGAGDLDENGSTTEATDSGSEEASTAASDESSTGEEMTDPPTTWPEQIAFDAFFDGALHFGVVDVETGEVTMLSPPQDSCRFGDWSPDGRNLAYQCRDGIYVAWGDGSHATRVLEDAASWARWSPRGDELAVWISNTAEIWTVPVEGGVARRVASDVDDVHALQWSPDGRRLAVRRDGDGVFGYVIGSIDVDTGAETILHQDPGSVFSDGLDVAQAGIARGFIAYPVTLGSDHTRVFAIDFTGGGLADISGLSNRLAHDPVWSPAGSYIAWTELSGSDSTLTVALPDGSQAVRFPIPNLDTPTWSPDETRIAGTFGPTKDELHVIELASGEVTVVPTDISIERPRWRPHPG